MDTAFPPVRVNYRYVEIAYISNLNKRHGDIKLNSIFQAVWLRSAAVYHDDTFICTCVTALCQMLNLATMTTRVHAHVIAIIKLICSPFHGRHNYYNLHVRNVVSTSF